jgi:hypothetical protein
MSKLPGDKQVAFWVVKFKPLMEEEGALNVKAEAIRKQLTTLSDVGTPPQ